MPTSGRNAEYSAGLNPAHSLGFGTIGMGPRGSSAPMDSQSGGSSGSTTGNKRFDVKGTNISLGMGSPSYSAPEPAPKGFGARIDSGSNYGASRGSSFSNAMKAGMSYFGSGGGMMGLGKMD
jgi:hypothetical protein